MCGDFGLIIRVYIDVCAYACKNQKIIIILDIQLRGGRIIEKIENKTSTT